jgi:hypothetical protein
VTDRLLHSREEDNGPSVTARSPNRDILLTSRWPFFDGMSILSPYPQYPLPEGASCPGKSPRGWVSCVLISYPKFLQNFQALFSMVLD